MLAIICKCNVLRYKLQQFFYCFDSHCYLVFLVSLNRTNETVQPIALLLIASCAAAQSPVTTSPGLPKTFDRTRFANAGHSHGISVDTVKGLDGVRMLTAQKFFDTSFKENEKVAVFITVDSTGNVINASYQSQGSTTSRDEYVKKAMERAYRMKFSRSSSVSKGTVIFDFRILHA